jgi:hypothetical protein
MTSNLQDVINFSKDYLKNIGTLPNLVYWFKGDKLLFGPKDLGGNSNLTAEENKTRSAFATGLVAKKLGADLVIMSWDAAFRSVDSKDVDPTEAPLLYPRSHRTECLMFESVSLPSGTSKIQVIPYKGGEGEAVEFLPGEDFIKDDMKFESRFTKIVVEGWNKADIIM